MTPAEIVDSERTRQSLSVLCNEQTRLMLAQNAATLGRLAAAISHEMNTPLAVLRSSADTLLKLAGRESAPSQVSADLLRAIRESADRLSEVVGRMQRFTNLNRAEVQKMCVNGLISDAAGLLDPDVREGIELKLAPGLPYVMGHPQQLSAVFLMLLNNAVDSGGNVRVVTWTGGSDINIEFRDDGRGIPEHLLAEIFEPAINEQDGRMRASHWNFFSCRHIVEAHRGSIQIASVEGEGTTVRITLPAAHAER